jgi:MATE family multidrug resistance protein
LQHSIVSEAKGLILLATPIVLASMAQILMHLTDMLMLGRYNSEQFAAAGIAGAMWFVPMLVIMGSLQGVSALIANAIGETSDHKVAKLFQHGCWLAVGIALITTLMLPLIARMLLFTDIQTEIVNHTMAYLDILALTLPAATAYTIMRFYAEGIEYVMPMLIIQLIILPLNFLGNYALIYGNWGFPELGIRGAGYSSVFGFWLSAVMLYVALKRSKRTQHYQPFVSFTKPQWKPIKVILMLGLPIAASMFLEHTLFLASFIMMGYFGTLEAAAHNIAMNYTEITFMVPLGIASALTVKVGNARGRGELSLVKLRGWTGISLAAFFMFLSVFAILLFRHQIAAFYTPDQEIVSLAATFLIFAAIFQISDGTQVAAAGALRGMEDTRITMHISLFAYWLIGLPVTVLFGFSLGFGGVGIWLGLIAGLTIAAILMCWRFRWIIHHESSLYSSGAAT